CLLAVWLGRKRPWLFAGWFWFLGMLVPVIGIVQVGVQSMADRYTYLPLTGVFIIIAWSAAELAQRGNAWKYFLSGAGVLVLAACAWRTSDQLRHWRDSELLSRYAIALTQKNDVAYSNLGNFCLENGRLD